ncbi:MAG: hypothetical protein LBH95_06260 [Oscillospiraceae bacterium]|jgi:hypothetical protein|nr:hypothetical protein [Oscillospiraceae bacterium]
MRVNTLRVMTVALAVVLINVNLSGYEFLPDIVGLALFFFCAVLMTDRAGRFARAAVVSAVMLFLEAVRLLKLTEAPLAGFLNLLYMFMTVLLVITAADGVGQFGLLNGNGGIDRRCDMTGHVFALTFPLSALAMWFPATARVLGLVNLLISIFVLLMFASFYSTIYATVQPRGEILMDTEGSGGEEDAAEEDGELSGEEEPVPETAGEPV